MGEKVILRSAWEWTCPKCARDNYERAPVRDMPEDYLPPEVQADLREAREAGYEGVCGEYLYAPERVTCRACDSKYEAEADDMGKEQP